MMITSTDDPTIPKPNHVQYREFRPHDIAALKLLHRQIFPIDYDHSFFQNAVDKNDILGWAAVIPQNYALDIMPDPTTVFVDGEQIIGFITAKHFSFTDIPRHDQALMNVTLPLHNNQSYGVMYILTLGVVERYRHQGIASSLLNILESHAKNQSQCIGLYLHVITYNTAAQNFYHNNQFHNMGILSRFYHIKTGRALHADQTDYDACLLLKLLTDDHRLHSLLVDNSNNSNREEHVVDMDSLLLNNNNEYIQSSHTTAIIDSSSSWWLLIYVQAWLSTIMHSVWQLLPRRKKVKSDHSNYSDDDDNVNTQQSRNHNGVLHDSSTERKSPSWLKILFGKKKESLRL